MFLDVILVCFFLCIMRFAFLYLGDSLLILSNEAVCEEKTSWKLDYSKIRFG